jgi:hypothetical protein
VAPFRPFSKNCRYSQHTLDACTTYVNDTSVKWKNVEIYGLLKFHSDSVDKFAAGVTAISVSLWKGVITGVIETGTLRCEYLSEFSKKIEVVLSELKGGRGKMIHEINVIYPLH